MGVRFDHRHDDGRVCYRTRSRHPLTRITLIRHGTKEFAVGYMAYTGHWYVYDVDTGREVATLTRDFFTHFIAPNATGYLDPDPDCVPA